MEKNTHYLRPLQIQDLPHIGHLQPKGWDNMLQSILSYCMQPFCRPIKVLEGDRIIGVGNIVLHQGSGWLSHIIVDSAHRGKGVGQQIVEHLLDIAAEHRLASVNLIATDLGAPVYEKAGFRPVGDYIYLKKIDNWIFKGIPDNVRSGTSIDHHQIFELDRQISGENRVKLIEDHVKNCIVFDHKGTVEGYYLPHLGQGPIYALTGRAGLALMALKYSSADIAVLPKANTVGVDFLVQRGFEIKNNTAIRMVYGQETLWQPQHIYSRIGGNHG